MKQQPHQGWMHSLEHHRAEVLAAVSCGCTSTTWVGAGAWGDGGRLRAGWFLFLCCIGYPNVFVAVALTQACRCSRQATTLLACAGFPVTLVIGAMLQWGPMLYFNSVTHLPTPHTTEAPFLELVWFRHTCAAACPKTRSLLVTCQRCRPQQSAQTYPTSSGGRERHGLRVETA